VLVLKTYSGLELVLAPLSRLGFRVSVSHIRVNSSISVSIGVIYVLYNVQVSGVNTLHWPGHALVSAQLVTILQFFCQIINYQNFYFR